MRAANPYLYFDGNTDDAFEFYEGDVELTG